MKLDYIRRLNIYNPINIHYSILLALVITYDYNFHLRLYTLYLYIHILFISFFLDGISSRTLDNTK